MQGLNFNPCLKKEIMKKVVVYIEKSDNGFSAYMAENTLDYGIRGEGSTARETIADFKDSYAEMREFYKEQGKKFEEAEFEYRYDIPSFLQYYAFAFTLAGLERITGVNQKQLGHYINGIRKPSAATAKKIEERMIAFAKELEMVKFV